MRYVLAPLLLALLVTPAAARPHRHARRHRAPPAKVRHIVPNDAEAKAHERAEAELADLRAGKVSVDESPPPDIAGVQEDDAEKPPLQARGQR